MNAATSHAHALLHPLRGYLMQKVDQAITATGMRLAQEFGTINEHTAQRERQLIALSSRQQDNGASAAEANALRQERHSLREECMRLTEDLKNAQEAQVRMKDNLMKLYNACFALREEGSKLREERVALREENWALRKEIARLVDAGNENVQSSGSLGKVEGEAAQERSGLVASVLSKVQQELTRRHNAAKEVAFLEQVVKEIAPSEPTVNSASQDVKESSEDPVARLLAQSSPVVLSRLASLSCSRSEARINHGTPPVQASPVRKFEPLQTVDNVPSSAKSEPDPEPRLLPAQTANISRRSAVPPSSIREVIDLSNILDSPPRRFIGIEDALPSPTNDLKKSAPHLTRAADSEVNAAMDVDVDRKREREGSPEQPEHPAKRRRTSDEVTDSASGTVETPQLTEEKLVAATEPLHRSRSSEDWLAYALKEESERVTTPDEMKSLQERLVSMQPSEDMSISESGSVATISTPGLETSAPVVESVKLVKTSALAAAETVAETTKSEVMESVSLNEPRMSRVGLGDNTKDQHEASEGNLSASASAGTKSWVVDDQNAPRAQYHRTKLLSAAKRPEETPLIEAYKQAEVQSRAPQTPQVQLEGPRPPTRPQHRKHLSLRHVPLMYRSTKTGMICRMCLSRKEVRDRKLPVTTFPLAASWVELASHCETVHPRAYETLIGMAPEEIEEAKLKLGSK